MIPQRDWLNAPYDPYTQYTYEIGAAEHFLLQEFGWFFDDEFFYWQPKKKKDIIKRAPLWMYPQRGIGGHWIEKWHKYSADSQTKLGAAAPLNKKP